MTETDAPSRPRPQVSQLSRPNKQIVKQINQFFNYMYCLLALLSDMSQ